MEKPVESPSLERWAELYDCAARIKALAPWEHLWDADLVAVELPETEEPVFISAMGRSGECHGVSLYPGFAALSALTGLVNASESVGAWVNMRRQRCLACYYGDREELRSPDRAVLKALGLRYRGRGNWVYFRTIAPGMMPWYLSDAEATLMAGALKQYCLAVEEWRSEGPNVEFTDGQMLLRHYRPGKKVWANAAARLPYVEMERPLLIVQDELFLASLRKRCINQAELELELCYAPLSVQQDRAMPPRFPRVVMLLDRQSSVVLDQDMPEREGKTLAEAMLAMLRRYILEKGRPAKLYVRDDEVCAYVSDLCNKIGVPLSSGQPMLAADQAVQKMMAYFLR